VQPRSAKPRACLSRIRTLCHALTERPEFPLEGLVEVDESPKAILIDPDLL
jgi:hypothetical protein